jgi:glycerate kinase
MVVLVCPASFKEVLPAPGVAAAMADGVRDAGHEPRVLPLADGGEGTLECLAGSGGPLRAERVQGPYGGEVEAAWAALSDGTALVEMAQASGLALAPPANRDLLRASSFGTGQLLRAALRSSPARLVAAVGGTATNDGGLGAMRALGARFLDVDGRELTSPASLVDLCRVEALPTAGWPPVVLASDVDNPLTGPEGATRMFGRQKGGTPEVVEKLERAMERYAQVLEESFGWNVAGALGAGAGGGMGAALLAFLGARFKPGIDLVMDAVSFDACVREADLLLTGEGSLDVQSPRGKTVAGVLRKAAGKPVFAVCGRLELGEAEWRAWGLSQALAASPERVPSSPEEAQRRIREAVVRALASVSH